MFILNHCDLLDIILTTSHSFMSFFAGLQASGLKDPFVVQPVNFVLFRQPSTHGFGLSRTKLILIIQIKNSYMKEASL
jgi:hypothetical protein